MTQSIPLAGVIGFPIGHSRSPRVHNHWLEHYGLRGHYVPLEVSVPDLETALNTLPRLGFVGANVTIPHKESVMKFADQVSDRAALIGAANTMIFKEDGKIHADNTDGYGFLENLKQEAPGWNPEEGPAAVIGAGGAARAVIASLLEAGAPSVLLSNRTKTRAEALREEFGVKVEIVDWVKAGDMFDGAATVVNTTSLGMEGAASMSIPLDALNPSAVVNDLVYAPLETAFLARARALGCRTVDGLGMLLHQAVPGFERWFGIRPAVDGALRDAVLK